MSLLDNGPHTLVVQRMKDGPKDRYGATTKIPDGDPITVTGAMVHPLTTDELLANGVTTDEIYKVRCRVWPGGVYSKVTWDGRSWSQKGPTRKSSVGKGTPNQSALLVADAGEVH